MKLLVCDVEGTIFKAKFRFKESQYASSMWQPLARDLQVEAEENFSHGKWENSRRFPSKYEEQIAKFKSTLLNNLNDIDANEFNIKKLEHDISEKLKKEDFDLFEEWFKSFIEPMFTEGKNFYDTKSDNFINAIIEDIKNDKYKYTSYMDWVDETVQIHKNAPSISLSQSHDCIKLTKGVFDKLLNEAEYNDGVKEFFDTLLDRNEYIPVLISGGFQELVRRAQKECKIKYGFGACEYSWKPVKKIIDGKEMEIITEESELENYFIQPSDFENKFAYLNMFFNDFGLDPTKDWVFIGDGKNDVDIASKAPISFAINPHEDLASVATYTVESFTEIGEKLEKIKKHESPIYVSKNNQFSNKQAVQTFERELNEKAVDYDTKNIQNISNTLLFDASFKIYTDGNEQRYIEYAKEIIKNVCHNGSIDENLSNRLVTSYEKFDLNEKFNYTYKKSKISILPSIEKTVIRISRPDEGTPLRLPIAGRKIIEEICFINNSSNYSDLDVAVFCEGPAEYKDFIEAYRPDFLNKIKNDLTYDFENKTVQAKGCQFKKFSKSVTIDFETIEFDKPIILLDKSKWNEEFIDSLKSSLLGFALIVTYDNSKQDNNTFNLKYFVQKYKNETLNELLEEDKKTIDYLKNSQDKIIGAVCGKGVSELSCLNSPFCNKFKNIYFITEKACEKSKDISICASDTIGEELVYKRNLIKSGPKSFLLSLSTDIFSACKKAISPTNYYIDFLDEIKKATAEKGAKSKFLLQRDKSTDAIYSEYFEKIDFENTEKFIKNYTFDFQEDYNHFLGYKEYIFDGLKIIESYRFFNEQNESDPEMPLAILQPLFNALELYARARLLMYFDSYVNNIDKELKKQTLGGLCYLFGHIVDSYNNIEGRTESNDPYFLKASAWRKYYNSSLYLNVLEMYESVFSFFELCRNRGKIIAHNSQNSTYSNIKEIIAKISDAFSCIDKIFQLDISKNVRPYAKCWDFWMEGKNKN